MISDITQDIKTTLQSLNSYGGTPTVELERLYMVINNRYPFIEIAGPYIDTETQIHQVAQNKLEYIIKYFVQYNDEDQTEDEIVYVTRNVTGNIIKILMVDIQRGGNAIITKVTDYGNSFELINEDIEFFLYVRLEITVKTDAQDPSLIG